MLIRISNTAIVFLFEFVFHSVRRRIATSPERLDELVPFFVVRELLECAALFVGDNPPDIFVEPLLVGLAQLLLQRLGIFFALLLAQRTLERVGLLVFIRGTRGLFSAGRLAILS